MQTETSFEKVSSFVKDQVLFGTDPYIRSMPYGYKINGFMIKKSNNIWQLFDQRHQHRHDFNNRRIAVLAAIMLIKNKQAEFTQLQKLDRSLHIFDADRMHYNDLYRKNPFCGVYQARIDRVEQGIDCIKLSLSQMEKSVNLL